MRPQTPLTCGYQQSGESRAWLIGLLTASIAEDIRMGQQTWSRCPEDDAQSLSLLGITRSDGLTK